MTIWTFYTVFVWSMMLMFPTKWHLITGHVREATCQCSNMTRVSPMLTSTGVSWTRSSAHALVSCGQSSGAEVSWSRDFWDGIRGLGRSMTLGCRSMTLGCRSRSVMGEDKLLRCVWLDMVFDKYCFAFLPL